MRENNLRLLQEESMKDMRDFSTLAHHPRSELTLAMRKASESSSISTMTTISIKDNVRKASRSREKTVMKEIGMQPIEAGTD